MRTHAGMSWQQAVAKAESFLAINQPELIFYHSDYDDMAELPWEHVTSMRVGGTHRFDMDTTVTFTAKHPSGLTFVWFFDIEPREANGKPRYYLDLDGVRRVLEFLPLPVKHEFQDYLAKCAEAVHKQAVEFWEHAQKEFQDEETLRQMAAAKFGE